MTVVEYPGVYRDARGEEAIVIRNDGKTPSLTIRGVEFAGSDFDRLEPTVAQVARRLGSFVLDLRRDAALCDCVLSWDVRVALIGACEPTGVLHARLEPGAPAAPSFLDGEDLRLSLEVGEPTYASAGTSGWFEGELLSLQAALRAGVSMKVCFKCAFSDYSVYGNGLFGDMLCFRDTKAAYMAVRDKS